MAYEISFTARITVADPEIYINDCCWGGDVIRDRLLPVAVAGYGRMQTHQEDWGWFIWLWRGRQRTHIDIFCDDREQGEFRLHIYGARRKCLRLKLLDGIDIEPIKEVNVTEIEKWGQIGSVRKFTPDFMTELD